MIRIVLFDRTTGEPAEIIESHDASFAQLNGNREKYISKEIGPAVNWRNAVLNLETGEIVQRTGLPDMPSSILLPGQSSTS